MRLLVIRTSAMGDVSLTIPVLKEIREQYPDIEIIFLTRELFSPFLVSVPGVVLFSPDFNGRHKGIFGLFRLYRDVLKEGRVEFVIDLHDVIRSKILRSIFKIGGASVKIIDKGRREKRALIVGRKKIKLKHTVERYREVFKKAGFSLTPSTGHWIQPTDESIQSAVEITGISERLNIGVAPFAKHYLKMWPEKNMISLLKIISDKYNAKFWLFGGKNESERLNSFQKNIPDSVAVSLKLTLAEELGLMTRLHFMISMDSSNMHMAALTGTKVISIWGGTDPLTGFGALVQPDEYSIRIPVGELTCRPCTIYGKGKCKRGDHACMVWLTPEIVFEKIINLDIL